jgi:hypothetical protein
VAWGDPRARELGGFVGAGSCDWGGTRGGAAAAGLFPGAGAGAEEGETEMGRHSRWWARAKSGQEIKNDGEVLFGPNPNFVVRVRTDRLRRPYIFLAYVFCDAPRAEEFPPPRSLVPRNLFSISPA